MILSYGAIACEVLRTWTPKYCIPSCLKYLWRMHKDDLTNYIYTGSLLFLTYLYNWMALFHAKLALNFVLLTKPGMGNLIKTRSWNFFVVLWLHYELYCSHKLPYHTGSESCTAAIWCTKMQSIGYIYIYIYIYIFKPH